MPVEDDAPDIFYDSEDLPAPSQETIEKKKAEMLEKESPETIEKKKAELLEKEKQEEIEKQKEEDESDQASVDLDELD